VEYLSARWIALLLGGGLVLVAWLINRFAPKYRRRIRRVVIMFVLYLLALGVAASLRALHAEPWAYRALVVTDLLELFTIINLFGLAIFDLAFPVMNVDLVSITSDLLVGFAYIVATIAVLHGSGMNLSSVITTSAVIGGVLTLSLQATLGNILGGVALQLDGSIHVGDWIQLENGRQGKVREIRWRHTVLETRDWDTVIVPNASLLSSNITILGKREGALVPHRMWVYFHVDFRYSPSRVIQIVDEALKSAPIENVAGEPLPNTVCLDLARDAKDSFALYGTRYWLTNLAVDDPTSTIVRARIYAALKRAGIPLARPSSTIFLTPEDESAEKRRAARHFERHVAALGELELFRTLTPAEREELARHLIDAPFVAGETMTKQGAVAHWLYILVAGRAEVRTSVGGTTNGESIEKRVATIDAPGFFGEMGLMTGEPRHASVIALADAECYRLEKEALEKIIKVRPEIADEISRTLAHRMVELIAVRDGLDAEAKRSREESEQERILKRIQVFFGL
jgi:small-conductance mechanosensitive channel/CRP-like cAMP-binding protein